jgi:hypothetical protein
MRAQPTHSSSECLCIVTFHKGDFYTGTQSLTQWEYSIMCRKRGNKLVCAV